jgi:pimeloyl-ACP methyl ester carboxylesterase
MKRPLAFLLLSVPLVTLAQKPALSPARQPARTIQPSACPIKIDSSFQTRCGYLLVPENRTNPNSRTIKLPFIIAYSKNPNKRKDPLLYTTGGPGGSSLGWIRGAIRHSVILDRDCIAFEQRGTYYAQPCLDGPELSDAIRESYRKNLNKDSMMLVGVQRFKKALQSKGIDLTGYNTDETVADIDDLLIALNIDSVNLLGVSYSGGLMLDVLRKDPARIRSLILDSPLPNFIPIDEDEPANFIEALRIVFQRCAKDSADKELYGNLYPKFQQYFTSLKDKVFSIPYVEKGTTDTLHVQYTRNDLLNVLVSQFYNVRRIKDIPYMVTEMINGRHDPYIRPTLDDIFRGDTIGPNGMRLSVYCADQTAYHEEGILHQLNDLYPYMSGYHINDVYREICDCWQSAPIKKVTKQPFYSDKPALLGDGELDPACRPLYIARVHHYLPNSQRLVFPNRSHVVFFNDEMDAALRAFLNDPWQKVSPPPDAVLVE